ncbi:hypothetical protein HanRHA438_Chr12g0576111 [Helianthus annuus]|nr:hypothetical protein HanIR_Chr12g0609991 [Helianthus annuus]KAJ0868579.1 hypothetical protein HanRHA438_Chr12g0576111 [Helianthus annuus]
MLMRMNTWRESLVNSCTSFVKSINRRLHNFLHLFSLSLFRYLHSSYIYVINPPNNNNNNKALSHFKCCNSRSPLPFPIDLKPITHVRALAD